jgi:hypothetical protein
MPMPDYLAAVKQEERSSVWNTISAYNPVSARRKKERSDEEK